MHRRDRVVREIRRRYGISLSRRVDCLLAFSSRFCQRTPQRQGCCRGAALFNGLPLCEVARIADMTPPAKRGRGRRRQTGQFGVARSEAEHKGAVVRSRLGPFSLVFGGRPYYFIECSPIRFPSVSMKTAKKPNSSVNLVFGVSTFPPAEITFSNIPSITPSAFR